MCSVSCDFSVPHSNKFPAAAIMSQFSTMTTRERKMQAAAICREVQGQEGIWNILHLTYLSFGFYFKFQGFHLFNFSFTIDFVYK